MFTIFSLLVPSIITIRLQEFITKKKEKDLYKRITNYIILVFLNNIATCAIFIKVFNAEWVRYELLKNLNTFSICMIFYSGISVLVGIAFIIIMYLLKNAELDFETKNKKNNI